MEPIKHPGVTSAIVLDTRRIKKDGSYPIKLRITLAGKQNYYSTGLSAQPEDFEKAQGARPRGEHKLMALQMAAYEEKAIDTLNQMSSFSFEAFKKKFNNTSRHDNGLHDLLKDHAKELESEKRLRTAEQFLNASKSLKKFTRNRKLYLQHLTPKFLEQYESWMLNQGKSISTVGIYLRAVRTLYNSAIREGIVSRDAYPFGTGGYTVPTSSNKKKAISQDVIRQFVDYEAEPGSREEKFRDYWLILYLGNGMNVTDLANLTYANLDGDQFSFVREKTRRTTRKNQKRIVVRITPKLWELIQKWGNGPEGKSDDYLFPILEKGMTEEEKLARTKLLVQYMNKYTRKIAKKLGLEKDITTYTARHSFSTNLYRGNVPIDSIKEALGHNSISTTEKYLASMVEREDWEEKLL